MKEAVDLTGFDKPGFTRHLKSMDYQNAPHHRFFGWQIVALIAVAIAYTMWFVGPGPYGQLADLAPGMPMEEKVLYSGADAVSVLSGLDNAGRRTKLTSLLFDIPYMILNMLVFEALIAFGIRRMSLKGSWALLFTAPLAFLFADLLENGLLAATLLTGNTIMGWLAGVFAGIKFLTFGLSSLAALVMAIAGLVAFLMKRNVA